MSCKVLKTELYKKSELPAGLFTRPERDLFSIDVISAGFLLFPSSDLFLYVVSFCFLLLVGDDFAKVGNVSAKLGGVSSARFTGSLTSRIARVASSSEKCAGYLAGTCGLGRCCTIVMWNG